MSSSDGPEDYSVRKRAYVALLEAEDAREDERDVLIGNRVSQAAIKRSVLLSGIENTHGHASLPSQLCSEEVRLWETACAVEFDIPVNELVTVLKVADALGDKAFPNWAEKLAERAKATDWQDVQKADAMLGALLRLPPHLLPSILTKCGGLDVILSTFPPPLHLAAVCAASLDSFIPGAVHVQHCNAAAALHAVASAPAPITSIRSISFQSNESATSTIPTATGALLARAACSLASLADLQLTSEPLPQQWLDNFAACLTPGALPGLVSLSLSTDASPASRTELLSCLAHLPALKHLSVSVQLAGAPASAEVSLQSFTRCAASPAALPNLVELNYEEGLLERGCDFPAHIDRPSCASSFLPLLSAPSVGSFLLRTLAASSPLQAISASINRHSGLQSLMVEGTLRGADVSRTVCASDVAPPKMPPLVSVCTGSSCPVSAVAMAAYVASGAQQSLTSLDVALEARGATFSDRAATPEMLTRVWRGFSTGLRRLAGLQQLYLDCICGIAPQPAARAAFSESLAAGLAHLTQLTALQLGAAAEHLTPDGTSVLIGASIGGAISAMTGLASLLLTNSRGNDGAELQFDSVQPLFDVCAQLEKLRYLRFDCRGVELRQVSTFLAEQCALTYLGLGGRSDDSSLVRAADEEWAHEYPHICISVKQ